MSEGNTLETDRIIQGDCRNALGDLPDESVHSIVTDPPYGLNFMPNTTNGWDDFEPKEYQQWCENWARRCLEVLKPGGHLLAFSGNRTHHRLFTGVEDAGFTVRDTITWHYGSGFPKSLDVSKAIDKQAGEERELGEPKRTPDGGTWDDRNPDSETDKYGEKSHETHETKPATSEAEQWDGWKTHLKPATEFVVLARKPFDGTVAENTLEHGTSALNIDGTRIETDGRPMIDHGTETEGRFSVGDDDLPGSECTGTTTEGRYPANVIFDERAAQQLDNDVGETSDSTGTAMAAATDGIYGDYSDDYDNPSYNDSGGPSRYFYTSKATKAERTLDGKIENAHPTVKPQDFMEWLVKLVTAEEQIVLDPFAGTGTTCKAAKDLGRRFIGIEKQAKWADVSRVRCGLQPEDPSHVRPDSELQRGLESFADADD